MKIDILAKPPVDIFRGRGMYLRVSIVLLFLVFCGLALIVYSVYSERAVSEAFETAAFALFVGPGLVFVYFGGKLRDFKRLGPPEKERLAGWSRKHPEVAAYLSLVEEEGREPIFAEYEACQEWVEDQQFER